MIGVGVAPHRGPRAPGRQLDWLVVGGGLHGVHLAVQLLAEGGVDPDRLAIVDPSSRLLARWRANTSATGMAYLRSAAVHHLDVSPHALMRFAGRRRDRDPGLFTPPYDRPALALFDAHCDHVIESYGLDERHVRDRVVRLRAGDDRVTADLGGGARFEATRVVLALGASEQPHWPGWAPREHARVHHLFEQGPYEWPTAEGEDVAVVGGGVSAAQVAVRLASEGHRVRLVSRHALREHQFDSDPGWLGPKRMASFSRTRDVDLRRRIIDAARNRGSMPPDVRRSLQRAVQRGSVQWSEAEVEDLRDRSDRLSLHLTNRRSVQVDRVVLATGFRAERPGGALIDDLIATAALPVARCGYPIVDTSLRWHPRVHVTGPLAELELGPTARNIAGARRAGDRILDAVRAARADEALAQRA